jgi:hypothetical protein
MAWRGPTVQPSINPAPNPVQYGMDVSGRRIENNRAENIRRDTDKVDNFSVTLVDIDTAIVKHLDNVINASIIAAGVQVKVPVNYASPERWKSIQSDGFIRDKNGKVQCPAIAVRRSTMSRNDNLTTLNRYLQYPTVKHFSPKNQYDRFSTMNGFQPTKEIYSVALPDHVIINYDIIVWTDLVEQGNSVIEKINFATEDYWGDPERFKFRTSISDYNFQVEINSEQDRMVKSTFSMMAYAYLLPDHYENYKSVVQKSFTPRKIVFSAETTTDNLPVVQNAKVVAKTTELNGNVVPVIDESSIYKDQTAQPNDWINTKVLEYQSFITTKTGSLVTLNNGSGSAIFSFASTSFNPYGSPIEQDLRLIIDGLVVNRLYLTYYTTGSSLIANVVVTGSGVFPTTSSLIVGYGNLI